MSQTVLTLIGELQPSRAEAARCLIKDLREAIEEKGAESDPGDGDVYKPLVTQVRGLHFASIMLFDDERYDPMLTVELNFDGSVDAFLPQLETPMLLPHLRAILRCCKPPEGKTLPLYEAAICSGGITPYLKTLIVRPAVAHQGNRGLDRDRIIREAQLYKDVQAALEARACRDAPDAVALHAALRTAVTVKNSWLDQALPERIPMSERLKDKAKLALLVILTITVLFVPGILFWLLLPRAACWFGWITLLPTLAMAVAFVLRWLLKAAPRRPAQLPPERPRMTPLTTALAIVVLLFVAVCLAVAPLRAGLAGLVLVVAAIVIVLRRLETSDLVHEKPKLDPKRLGEIMAREDQISQNHMGSVVHVKPGVLRAVLIRLGLTGLGLLLRVKATDGYLADMRTIHFAHWALLDNGSRLLFFSNFDSSWESYLDDFIEKAHPGLTLAWSNGIGFPRTKFLVGEGATHGPLFKDWARHSMARGLFWVSAYPKLSVNQIERNYAIAKGLCARTLPAQAAETWAALL